MVVSVDVTVVGDTTVDTTVLVTVEVTLEVTVEVTVDIEEEGSNAIAASAYPEFALRVAGKSVGDSAPPVEYSAAPLIPSTPPCSENPEPADRLMTGPIFAAWF